MKKLQFDNNDLRSGQRAMFDKVVEVFNYNIEVIEGSDSNVTISDLSEEEIKAPLWKKWKALTDIKQLDVDTATTKDVAKAFNDLLKAIQV